MPRPSRELKALADKYKAEIMNCVVSYYDENQAMRTGIVKDVFIRRGHVCILVRHKTENGIIDVSNIILE